MKKAEAISILATSVRPREAKDRARYDEAVKMAIEALKCSETPKSSERTAKTAQDAQDKDLDWTILSKSIIPNLVPAGVVAGIVQNQLHLEESIHRIKQLTGISIDDLLNLLAQGYELKAPSTQTDLLADVSKKVERTAETAQNTSSSCAHENDVIFRKAAIDAVVDEFKRSPTPAIRAKLRLEALPPAQPEQRWIPSGERPPEEGSYLVWMPFAPPEERIAVADYCDGYWNIKTPISAWMPLPEPYRGGDEDERNRIIEIGFAHFDDLLDGMEAEL